MVSIEKKVDDQVDKVKDAEPFFDDDPRFFQHGVQESAQTWIAKLPPEWKVGGTEIDPAKLKFLFEVFNPYLDHPASFTLDSFLGVCSREFLTYFLVELESLLCNLSTRAAVIKAVEHFLINEGIFEEKVKIDSPHTAEPVTLDLVFPELINPIFTWYINKIYSYFEDTLNLLGSSPQKMKLIKILIRLGVYYGKFADTNPNAEKYKKIARRYIDGTDPGYIKSATGFSESEVAEEALAIDPPELQMLKLFWREYFTTAVVANSRINEGGDVKGLSRFAYVDAASRLPVDETTTAYPHSDKSARQAQLRAPDPSSSDTYNQVMNEQLRANSALERSASNQTKKLEEYFQQLVVAYGGDTFFSRRAGRIDFSRETHALNQVIPVIFLEFINHRMEAKNQDQALDLPLLWQKILDLTTKKQINLESIFSDSFSSLEPPEKICLVLFYGLTFSNPGMKLRPPIISFLQERNGLLAQLNWYHRSLPEEEVDQDLDEISDETKIEEEPNINSNLFAGMEAMAHERVMFLDRDLELVRPDNALLQAQIQERTEQARSMLDLVTTTLKRVEKRVSPPHNLTVARGIMFANVLWTLFLEPPSSTIIVSSIFFGAYFFALAQELRFEERKLIQNELREFAILEEEYAASLAEMAKKKNVSNKKIADIYKSFAALFILITIFVGAGSPINIRSELHDLNLLGQVFNSGDVNFESGITRMPDRVGLEGTKNQQPEYRGEVFDLPDTLDLDPTKAIGYFPTNWFESNGQPFIDSGMVSFANFEIVSSSEEIEYQEQPDEMAYSILEFGRTIYPPNGYKITRVFQSGGSQPMIGGAGQISYSEKPIKIFLVVTQVSDFETFNAGGRVRESADLRAPEYYAWNDFNYEAALELNQKLGNDPILQSLHRDFIEALKVQVDLIRENMVTNHSDFMKNYADLIKNHVERFGSEYVDYFRFYALLFTPGPTNGEYPALQALANQNQVGYFCTSGALSFSDFLTSLGIKVFTQPGNDLRNYDGELYSHIGHMNNIVQLPDGRLLFVDMTPRVTDQTPDEDIDALRTKHPTETERERQARKQVVVLSMVALSLVSGGYIGYQKMQKSRKKYVRKVENRLGLVLESATSNSVGLSVFEAIRNIVEFYDDPTYASRFHGHRVGEENVDASFENAKIIVHDLYLRLIDTKDAQSDLSMITKTLLLGEKERHEQAKDNQGNVAWLEANAEQFLTAERLPKIGKGIAAVREQLAELLEKNYHQLDDLQRTSVAKGLELLQVFDRRKKR